MSPLPPVPVLRHFVGAAAFALAAGTMGTGHAAECGMQVTGAGEVTAIFDGRTLQLADGRIIRLAGIDVPLAQHAEGDTAAAAAKAALASLVDKRSVTVRAPRDETDRYGRLVAYVFLPGSDRPVQQSLLEQGSARLSYRAADDDCRNALVAAEREARIVRRGLWADPRFAIRAAEPAADLNADRGRYVVVEGVVQSVRTSGATTYLNFARRWSEGFSVSLRKRDERGFAAAGLAPKTLEGKRIRVRGYVEQRSGPRIEASEPSQIEIAER